VAAVAVPAAHAPLYGSARPPRQPEQSGGGASPKAGLLQVSTGRAIGISDQSSRVVRQLSYDLSVAEQQRQKEAEALGCGVAVPASPLVDVLSVDDEASPDVSVVTQATDEVELAAKFFYSKHL